MTVDFSCVLDTELERFLVSDKDVANIHLRDAKLGLGALALSRKVQRKTLLIASDVSEGSARVVVGALWAESDTTGHLRVGPDLALERLDLENLVLEEHLVFLNGFPDAHVLAVERGDGSLLASLHLLLGLCLVVGVVRVQVAIVVVVLAGVDSLFDFVAFFLLLLGQLEVKPLLLLLLFDLRHECTPRELNRDCTFVDDLEVLVTEERNAGRVRVDVLLGQIHVVVVGFA